MAPTAAERAEVWAIRTAQAFLEQSVANKAIREHFWVLEDDHVRGLFWLSHYLRVWLLKGPGVDYCKYSAVEDPYEFCLNVLATATQYNFGRQCIYRFPPFWHDCEVHGSEAPPVLTRAEFEQILHADQVERDRLFDAFITTVRRPHD